MSNPEDFQDASTDYGPLTQRQAENIADLAERRARQRLYAEIGHHVVRKVLLICGAAMAAAIAWLSGLFHWGPK